MLAAQSKRLPLMLAGLDALDEPAHGLAQVHHFAIQLLHFSRQFWINTEYTPPLRFTDIGQELAAFLDDVR